MNEFALTMKQIEDTLDKAKHSAIANDLPRLKDWVIDLMTLTDHALYIKGWMAFNAEIGNDPQHP